MEQLIKQIEQWAEDRNIINGSKPIDQAMKLFSEFGELADNVGKGRDCRDDIGDVFVMLTIMAKQLNLNIKGIEIVKSESKPIFNLKNMVVDLGMSLNYFSRSENQLNLKNAVNELQTISAIYGYDLKECVQIAYNDIKDRKGILWNGVFVKESDLSYNACVEAYRESLSEKNTEN